MFEDYGLDHLNISNFQIYNRSFAHKLKSINASIFFAEIYQSYLHFRSLGQLINHEKGDGLVYLTVEKCLERTAMSKDEQRTAINILIKHKLIEQYIIGVPGRRHFKILFENVRLFCQDSNLNSRKRESRHLESGNPDICVAGIPTCIKEPYKEPYKEQQPQDSSSQDSMPSASQVVVSFSDQKVKKAPEQDHPPDPKPKEDTNASDGTNDSLDKLKLTASMKKKLRSVYSPKELSDAVDKVLQWETRNSDVRAIQHILRHGEEWEEVPSVEKTVEMNRKALRETERKLAGRNIISGWSIDIGLDDITFSKGCAYKNFQTKDRQMIERISEFLVSIGLKR